MAHLYTHKGGLYDFDEKTFLLLLAIAGATLVAGACKHSSDGEETAVIYDCDKTDENTADYYAVSVYRCTPLADGTYSVWGLDEHKFNAKNGSYKVSAVVLIDMVKSGKYQSEATTSDGKTDTAKDKSVTENGDTRTLHIPANLSYTVYTYF